MRRVLAFMLAIVCLSPMIVHSATEYRPWGGPGANNAGDILLGSSYWDSPGGRRVYRINASTIPFLQDNAIKVGNANIYGLSAGVAQHWGIPYFDGSGNLNWLGMGLSGYCLKFNGVSSPPTASFCGGNTDYNPAAVAITGGQIGTPEAPATYIYPETITMRDGRAITFSDTAYPSDSFQIRQFDTTWKLQSYGIGASKPDTTPIYEINVNFTGLAGSLPPNKVVLRIKNNATTLFELLGDGRVSSTGTITAPKYATNTPSGYRRANVSNDNDSLLYSPVEGDFYYSKAQGQFVFYNASGQWTAWGSGGGTTLYVEDNFNRSNESPIGGNWNQYSWDGQLNLTGNQIAASSASGDKHGWRNSETYTDNQYSQAKLTSAIGSDDLGGPSVRNRWNGAYYNGYHVTIADNVTAGIYVNYDQTGDAEQVGSDISGTFAQNDTIKLGIAGNVLTLYRNGSSVASRTDSNNRIPSGGTAGVTVHYPGTWDDWRGGNQ